jgi:hypothetical protein
MKIRSGFVSNSSSSSFLIYGVSLEDSEIYEYLNITDEDQEAEDFDMYEVLEMADLNGMEFHHPEGYDSWYVGRCWSQVGDDETGRQFKDRTEKDLKAVFGDKITISTFTEAYYC